MTDESPRRESIISQFWLSIFAAVRRARAMIDSIGLTPEQLGIPLESAIQTPVVSCSSPFGFATDVCGSLPSCALHIWWALKTGVPPGPIGTWGSPSR